MASSTESHRDSIESIHSIEVTPNKPDMTKIPTSMSNSPDAMENWTSNVEVPDEIYDRLPPRRKIIIVVVMAWFGLLSPISSTAVLSASPEISETYHTTGDIVDLTNAIYIVGMAISPMFWGPLNQVYGRRMICIIVAVLFLGCSIGTALSPNLPAFFVFRTLTAFQGTSFLILGAACIGDIYRPTERATAISWFFSGTLIGPAIGPFLGGIIVTYTSWRVIFWLQAALTGPPLIASLFLLPETIHHRKADELVGLPFKRKARVLWSMINPMRVIKLYRYPNLIMVSIASGALLFSMYSLLTPIRYVLDPRFNLSSPLEGGLFYLAPGFGYLCGTFFGGRWADYTVRKWIKKRNGERVPEDRLRSCVYFIGGVIPACILIYGWSVDQAVGGIPLPIICMFVQGVAQLFCFPSLNTYCLDVMQHRSSEIIAGNYMARYVFGAIGTALVLPAVDAIGIGWFSTIAAGFLIISAGCVQLAIWYGKSWRDAVDKKRHAGRAARREAAQATEKMAMSEKDV